MRLTLATGITCIRIFLIPFIVAAIFQNLWIRAIWLFLIAALSDLCDGLIARLYNQESIIGAYLDPLADKLLLLSCYATLSYNSFSLFTIPTWLSYCLLIREGIVLIGAFFSILRHGTKALTLLRPTWSGKITTALHIILVSVCMLRHTVKVTALLFSGIIILVVGSTVYSTGEYIVRWYRSSAIKNIYPFIFLLILVAPSYSHVDEDTFTQPSRTSQDSYRSKCREQLAESFATYAQLLNDELCCLTQFPAYSLMPIEQIQLRFVQLKYTLNFIKTGQEYTQCTNSSQETCDIMKLIHIITQVQQYVLINIRCLLENDVTSCFVRTRAKKTLKGYLQTVKILLQEAEEAKRFIELIETDGNSPKKK